MTLFEIGIKKWTQVQDVEFEPTARSSVRNLSQNSSEAGNIEPIITGEWAAESSEAASRRVGRKSDILDRKDHYELANNLNGQLCRFKDCTKVYSAKISTTHQKKHVGVP